MKNSIRHGFTLIELLIVVAIIAILAAIAVPNFLEAQTRSKVSRVKSDQRSLATGLEAYYVDNNRYPPCIFRQDGQPSPVAPGAPTYPYVQRIAWISTPIAYITSIPFDPFAPEQTSGGSLPPAVQAENEAYPVYVYWDNNFVDGTKTSSPGPTRY